MTPQQRLKLATLGLRVSELGSFYTARVIADVSRCPTHVRFTPESGHVQRTRPCLLWANSGLTKALLDHVVGDRKQRGRDINGQGLSRLEIDNQFKAGR
jgi:hypothetical protein